MTKDNYNYFLPRLSLPEGDYKFDFDENNKKEKIIIESGDGEVVFEGQISDLDAEEISLRKDYTELAVKAENGVDLKKLTVTGHGSIFNDRYFMAFVFLLGLLWLLYVKYGKHNDNAEAYMPVFLMCVALLSSYMFFTNYLSFGHDILFHLERIEGIKEGLQSGQFPVRIQPRQINGYGYSVSLYYPDLFLYFPALLRLCGVSLVTAYQSLWIAASAATALITYYSVKGITKSRYAAAVAAVLYTTCTWRVFTVCIRGAMGEGLAMVFLPLLIYGIYEILWGDKKWYILTIAATCILQTHIISTVICVIFTIIVMALSSRRLARDKRWLALLKAAGMTLLINAWFIVAFITTYIGFDINGTFDLAKETEFPTESALPAQIFNVFGTSMSLGKPYLKGVSGSLALSPGIGVLAALAVCVLYFVYPGEREKNNGFMTMLFGSGVVLLIMSTTMFPWQWFAGKIGAVNALDNVLQFPWRFIALVSAIICIVGAWIISMRRNERSKSFILIISILCAAALLYSGASALTKDVDLKKGANYYCEKNVFASYDYLPAAVNTGASYETNDYKTSDSSLNVKDYKKDGTNINVNLSRAPGRDNCWVEVPLIYYWGYKAKDNAGQNLNVVQGDNGLLRVMLNSDSSGVKIKYSGTWFYRLGDIITMLTLIALLLRACKKILPKIKPGSTQAKKDNQL